MLRWGADVRMGMIRVNAVKKNGDSYSLYTKGQTKPEISWKM